MLDEVCTSKPPTGPAAKPKVDGRGSEMIRVVSKLLVAASGLYEDVVEAALRTLLDALSLRVPLLHPAFETHPNQSALSRLHGTFRVSAAIAAVARSSLTDAARKVGPPGVLFASVPELVAGELGLALLRGTCSASLRKFGSAAFSSHARSELSRCIRVPVTAFIPLLALSSTDVERLWHHLSGATLSSILAQSPRWSGPINDTLADSQCDPRFLHILARRASRPPMLRLILVALVGDFVAREGAAVVASEPEVSKQPAFQSSPEVTAVARCSEAALLLRALADTKLSSGEPTSASQLLSDHYPAIVASSFFSAVASPVASAQRSEARSTGRAEPMAIDSDEEEEVRPSTRRRSSTRRGATATQDAIRSPTRASKRARKSSQPVNEAPAASSSAAAGPFDPTLLHLMTSFVTAHMESSAGGFGVEFRHTTERAVLDHAAGFDALQALLRSPRWTLDDLASAMDQSLRALRYTVSALLDRTDPARHVGDQQALQAALQKGLIVAISSAATDVRNAPDRRNIQETGMVAEINRLAKVRHGARSLLHLMVYLGCGQINLDPLSANAITVLSTAARHDGELRRAAFLLWPFVLRSLSQRKREASLSALVASLRLHASSTGLQQSQASMTIASSFSLPPTAVQVQRHTGVHNVPSPTLESAMTCANDSLLPLAAVEHDASCMRQLFAAVRTVMGNESFGHGIGRLPCVPRWLPPSLQQELRSIHQPYLEQRRTQAGPYSKEAHVLAERLRRAADGLLSEHTLVREMVAHEIRTLLVADTPERRMFWEQLVFGREQPMASRSSQRLVALNRALRDADAPEVVLALLHTAAPPAALDADGNLEREMPGTSMGSSGPPSTQMSAGTVGSINHLLMDEGCDESFVRPAHEVVSQLVVALLARAHDPRIRVTVSTCLGALGPLHPGRLKMRENAQSRSSQDRHSPLILPGSRAAEAELRQTASLRTNQYMFALRSVAFDILEVHLAPALGGASHGSGNAYDLIAFAAQETMKWLGWSACVDRIEEWERAQGDGLGDDDESYSSDDGSDSLEVRLPNGSSGVKRGRSSAKKKRPGLPRDASRWADICDEKRVLLMPLLRSEYTHERSSSPGQGDADGAQVAQNLLKSLPSSSDRKWLVRLTDSLANALARRSSSVQPCPSGLFTPFRPLWQNVTVLSTAVARELLPLQILLALHDDVPSMHERRSTTSTQLSDDVMPATLGSTVLDAFSNVLTDVDASAAGPGLQTPAAAPLQSRTSQAFDASLADASAGPASLASSQAPRRAQQSQQRESHVYLVANAEHVFATLDWLTTFHASFRNHWFRNAQVQRRRQNPDSAYLIPDFPQVSSRDSMPPDLSCGGPALALHELHVALRHIPPDLEARAALAADNPARAYRLANMAIREAADKSIAEASALAFFERPAQLHSEIRAGLRAACTRVSNTLLIAAQRLDDPDVVQEALSLLTDVEQMHEAESPGFAAASLEEFESGGGDESELGSLVADMHQDRGRQLTGGRERVGMMDQTTTVPLPSMMLPSSVRMASAQAVASGDALVELHALQPVLLQRALASNNWTYVARHTLNGLAGLGLTDTAAVAAVGLAEVARGFHSRAASSSVALTAAGAAWRAASSAVTTPLVDALGVFSPGREHQASTDVVMMRLVHGLQVGDAADALRTIIKTGRVAVSERLSQVVSSSRLPLLVSKNGTTNESMPWMKDPYSAALPWILQLSMLGDADDFLDRVAGSADADHGGEGGPGPPSFHPWHLRFAGATPTFSVQEPLVSLQRALHLSADDQWRGSGVSRFGQTGGSTLTWWNQLLIAVKARKAGWMSAAAAALSSVDSLLLQSSSSLTHDEFLGTAMVRVEASRLKWRRGLTSEAIQELRSVLTVLRDAESTTATEIPLGSRTCSVDEGGRSAIRFMTSTMALQLAVWLQMSGEGRHRDIMAEVDSALEARPNWPTAHLVFADYTDALLAQAEAPPGAPFGRVHSGQQRSKDEPGAVRKRRIQLTADAVHARVEAVRSGCSTTQSPGTLPRLLMLLTEKFAAIYELDIDACNAEADRLHADDSTSHSFTRESSESMQGRATTQEGSSRRRSSLASSRRAATTQKEGASPPLTNAELDCVVQMMEDFRYMVYEAPVQLWMPYLAQVTTRIMSKVEYVHKLVEKIIVRCLIKYPFEAGWLTVGTANSVYELRGKTAKAAWQRAVTEEPSIGKMLKALNNFVSMLGTLAYLGRKSNKRMMDLLALPDGSKKNVEALKKLADSSHELSLRLPTQSSLLSNFGALGEREQAPMFKRFEREVAVFATLQRPKKVIALGDDGRAYPYLLKTTDDLRKDARMTELQSLMNALLRRDRATAMRGLSVRTYIVLPLSEQFGLIEWVEGTTQLRSVIASLYQEIGLEPQAKSITAAYQDAQEKGKAEETYQRLTARFPPLFHRWFQRNFLNPESWLRARQSFGRSLAVMSMVGYVVGLGDRHSENILLDERTGEVLHVDLNCIFQQGETFSVPERVPFRFTPNVRDGCGLGKGEGTFRRAAELSLAMLRSNRVTLLSVLEAMAHDPLLDWIPRNKQFSTRIIKPIKDPKPPSDGNFGRREMQAVEDKLLGLPPKSKILAKKRVGSGNDAGSSLPMSASGQVDMLISEAKSVQNLSAMYVGWASWL
jgi:hypothetical protein